MIRQFALSVYSLLFFAACTPVKMVVYNKPDVNDHKKFPAQLIQPNLGSTELPKSNNPLYPRNIKTQNGEFVAFDEYLMNSGTYSFIILQNDSIQYEQYFNKGDQSRIIPSFSMSKSIISLLIGMALSDGLIETVNDPVSKYVHELRNSEFDSTSIHSLLQMTSGIKFNENYVNPFSDAAQFYYGRKLEEKTLQLEIEPSLRGFYQYHGGHTQVLTLVLQRVLKNESIGNYLLTKLWKPLEIKDKADWSKDQQNGMIKGFCCLNTTARAFARIGQLLAHKGEWNGDSLIPSFWIDQIFQIDTSGGSPPYYQYHWWLPSDRGDLLADGILGQYIYVYPKKNLVIVRQGNKEGGIDWPAFFLSLSETY